MRSIALSDFDVVEEVARAVKWSEAEDDIIREHYILQGAKYVWRLLPHRSLNSIRQHAHQLGLRRWVRISK